MNNPLVTADVVKNLSKLIEKTTEQLGKVFDYAKYTRERTTTLYWLIALNYILSVILLVKVF